ncbi:MAG: class I SAM-dependent methyltransferase [Blastocatellia bacterium]|nr:MAG: class I SAM-dependent methyltransferase [Blastocatellia bacterium]
MDDDLQKSYDIVAGYYAAEFQAELEHKPFDRKMLDWLIEKVADGAIICDMGCGPGQIARYLRDRRAETCGIDLSNGMVRQASRLNPDIIFDQGDMRALTRVAENSFGGIAAFYSIIHIQRSSLVNVFREFHRVLKPAGVLLLTFHIGKEQVHRDEWWGKKVSINFLFFETAEIKRCLLEGGFQLSEVIERDPYPEVEYQSRRAYIFATKT